MRVEPTEPIRQVIKKNMVGRVYDGLYTGLKVEPGGAYRERFATGNSQRGLAREEREARVSFSRIKRGSLILSLLTALTAAIPSHAQTDTSRIGTVVDNFLIPIPEPDGICTDGSYFWIPNRALDYGPQYIYKIDSWTHEVVDSIPSPVRGPDGIAWDGSDLWVRGQYPNDHTTSLLKISPAGSLMTHIPAVTSCYWSGIAWDGRELYYGTNVCFASPKGQKSMIYKIDPATGAVIDSFPPPSGNINGLVYHNGNLWYYDDNVNYVFKIDTTGRILYEFPLPKKATNQFDPLISGLTIARNYLWLVDMNGINGPRVYGIDIGETPAVPWMIGCYTGPSLPGVIKIAWRPSSSKDVKMYKIYRDGPFQTGYGNLAKASVIDSVPANDTTYTDTIGISGLAFAYWVSAVDSEGVESHVSAGTFGAAWLPLEIKLGQNYPNPFNPTTTIPYQVSIPFQPSTHVTITVYDVLGRKVETLVNQDEGPGEKTVVFNASNLASGVYFYRMRAGSYIQTKKFMLIR